ncbi:uncharacterized protein MELLADRAFT_123424 [Melampsora larici-populina 98AG31]|uniref:Secreted protein n=1 Tax=Melampsora larici-populina (strain 98AG31 / pathotype 3-4-7) TaxID=747676 RepID=F4RJH6_MELLP|nr:uncharacterized protein MELLADRAFT_123424 [Melampsora larici-populina 98AG31]EGG07312.1 secreted protein [Melampsora larici-populina 98AG31]
MLHIFLKIAFLLYSLKINGLNAEKPLYKVNCNGGISFYSGGRYNVACRLILNELEEKHYNCKIENCLDDSKSHQWVPFKHCQLAKSNNKDFSNQQCSQYNYLGENKGYSCSNAAGYQYVCPDYNPYKVDFLTCEHCRAGNW